jgi:hypothetical protein
MLKELVLVCLDELIFCPLFKLVLFEFDHSLIIDYFWVLDFGFPFF